MKSFLCFLLILIGMIFSIIGLVFSYQAIFGIVSGNFEGKDNIEILVRLLLPVFLAVLGISSVIIFNRKDNIENFSCNAVSDNKTINDQKSYPIKYSDEVEISWQHALRFYWNFSWRSYFFTLVVFLIFMIFVKTLESASLISEVPMEIMNPIALLISFPVSVYVIKNVLIKEINGYRFAMVPALEKQIEESFKQ